jgi:acyl transferase domain-containing protein
VCVFAVEVGLAEVVKSWGVEPAAVVGHSIGEIAGSVVCEGRSLKEEGNGEGDSCGEGERE